MWLLRSGSIPTAEYSLAVRNPFENGLNTHNIIFSVNGLNFLARKGDAAESGLCLHKVSIRHHECASCAYFAFFTFCSNAVHSSASSFSSAAPKFSSRWRTDEVPGIGSITLER